MHPTNPPQQETLRRPYKLLDYYTKEDTEIYFGRGRDSDILASLINNHRLVVLYGASGTGKSSLILAGAYPLLVNSNSNYVPIYKRDWNQINNEIEYGLLAYLQNAIIPHNKNDNISSTLNLSLHQFRKAIHFHFNLSELRDLCFDLGIDHEDLAGETKTDKVRELINYCRRRNLLPLLLSQCKDRRSHAHWPKIENILVALEASPLKNEGESEFSFSNYLEWSIQKFNHKPIIIFDQFEEFFVQVNPADRLRFIKELASLYYAKHIEVNIVLSIREDWLPSLSEIQEYIPEVHNTMKRLLPLTREQAQKAIEGPVEYMGLEYEHNLVSQILDDLEISNEEKILPPQLQLVCSALYDTLAESQKQIQKKTYQKLNGTTGILNNYLENVLSYLKREDRRIAKSLLVELVTSYNTPGPKNETDLLFILNVSKDVFIRIANRLVRSRLLRRIEQLDTDLIIYELSHTYLINFINITPEEQERKRAEEILQKELGDWQEYGWLLSIDKLKLINERREFLKPSPDQVALLVHSSLDLDIDSDYWLHNLQNNQERCYLLSKIANEGIDSTRINAVKKLGDLNSECAINPLLDLFFHDENPEVQTIALNKLSGFTNYYDSISMNLTYVRARYTNKYMYMMLWAICEAIPIPIIKWEEKLRSAFLNYWLFKWIYRHTLGLFLGVVCASLLIMPASMAVGLEYIQFNETNVFLLAFVSALSFGLGFGFSMWVSSTNVLSKLLDCPDDWSRANISGWVLGVLLLGGGFWVLDSWQTLSNSTVVSSTILLTLNLFLLSLPVVITQRNILKKAGYIVSWRVIFRYLTKLSIIGFMVAISGQFFLEQGNTESLGFLLMYLYLAILFLMPSLTIGFSLWQYATCKSENTIDTHRKHPSIITISLGEFPRLFKRLSQLNQFLHIGKVQNIIMNVTNYTSYEKDYVKLNTGLSVYKKPWYRSRNFLIAYFLVLPPLWAYFLLTDENQAIWVKVLATLWGFDYLLVIFFGLLGGFS